MPSDVIQVDCRQRAASDEPSHRHDSVMRALRAQEKRGYFALRFHAALESDFRYHLARSGQAPRVAVFLIFLFITLTLSWFCQHVLNEPPAVATREAWIIYGLAPFMVLGLTASLLRPTSRVTDATCILIYLVSVGGILAMRSIAFPYDFNVPLLWVGLATTALVVAGRLRFWSTIPWVLVACSATVINEWQFVATRAQDYFPVVTLVLLIVITMVGGYALEFFMRKTWLNTRMLDYVSRHDGLTGLLNRHVLNRAVRRIIRIAHRSSSGFGVAMIDVDHFKRYNDRYGHLEGDSALRQVAKILQHAARRPSDICGRYGGEEFVLVWTGGEYEDLCQVAETLRARIEENELHHAGSDVVRVVTVSIGMQWISAHDVAELAAAGTIADVVPRLFAAADRLLYKAKVAGRNRVVSDSSWLP